MKNFILFAFLSLTTIANAQLKVCNETNETLSVAIKYYDKSNSHWVSIGWYIFKPYECDNLLDNLKNYGDGVYLVGRISSGQFSGNYSFCLQSKAFEYTEKEGEINNCYDPYFEKGAFQVATYGSLSVSGQSYTFRKSNSNYSRDKSALESLINLLRTPSNNNRSDNACKDEKCSNCFYDSAFQGDCWKCDGKRYYCTTHGKGHPHY